MFPQLGAFVRFDLSIPMYIPQFIPCLKILKGLSFLLAAISITFWGKPWFHHWAPLASLGARPKLWGRVKTPSERSGPPGNGFFVHWDSRFSAVSCGSWYKKNVGQSESVAEVWRFKSIPKLISETAISKFICESLAPLGFVKKNMIPKNLIGYHVLIGWVIGIFRSSP